MADGANAIAIDAHLAHYGVKGMKWGVITKGKRSSKKASKDADKAEAAKAKSERQSTDHKVKTALKTKPLDEMSNQELQAVITRMNLEQQYVKLNPPKVNPGVKFAKELAVNVAKKQVTDLANDQASKAIKGALAKKAAKTALKAATP